MNWAAEFNPGDIVLVRWEGESGEWKMRPGLVVEEDGELCRIAYGTSKHFCPSGRLNGEVALPLNEAVKLGLRTSTTFDLKQCRQYHVGQLRKIGTITGSDFAVSRLIEAYRELS